MPELKQLFKLAFFYFFFKIKNAFLPSLPPAHPSPWTHPSLATLLSATLFPLLQSTSTPSPFVCFLLSLFLFSLSILSIIPIFPFLKLRLLLITSQRCHAVLADNAHGCPHPDSHLHLQFLFFLNNFLKNN